MAGIASQAGARSSPEAPTPASLTRATFDAEFRRFTDRCADIIAAHPSSRAGTGQHPAQVYLAQYLSIYNRTAPSEHFIYFETFYNKNRAAILKVLDDDAWLRDGNHFIQYGEGAKVTNRQLEQCLRQSRLLLSAVYRLACQIRDDAQDRFDAGEELVASWDLIYPKIFLYHLYKLLMCNCTTSDRDRIFQIVESLAVDLSIIQPKAADPEVPQATAAPAPAQGPGVFPPGMPDLAEMMGKMFSGIMPAGAGGVPENVTSNIMSSLLQSPLVKETMEEVVTKASQNSDWGDIMGGIFSKFQQPEAMQALQQTLSNPETNAFIQQAVGGAADPIPDFTIAQAPGAVPASLSILPPGAVGAQGPEPSEDVYGEAI